eukprot:scaffold226276_cov13-Tisochrysis_lutea.AAC.1
MVPCTALLVEWLVIVVVVVVVGGGGGGGGVPCSISAVTPPSQAQGQLHVLALPKVQEANTTSGGGRFGCWLAGQLAYALCKILLPVST